MVAIVGGTENAKSLQVLVFEMGIYDRGRRSVFVMMSR